MACYSPSLNWCAGVNSWCTHSMTNFSLDCIYCRHPAGRKAANLIKFWTLRALVPNPPAARGQIWLVRVRLYTWQISFAAVFAPPLRGAKPQIWPCFQIQHSMLAPPSNADTNLNAMYSYNLTLFKDIKIVHL